MIPKKLMKEFFAGMLQQEHPGEGAQVGKLTRKKSEGWFHWSVEILFEGGLLEIDPLIWFKIRGTILQESFEEAMGKCRNVVCRNVVAQYEGEETVLVSSVIEFEETDLVEPWPGLFEGENPYDFGPEPEPYD